MFLNRVHFLFSTLLFGALFIAATLASQPAWAQRAGDSSRPISGVIAASTAPVQISYTPENSAPIGRVADIGDPVYLNDEITTGPTERLQLLLADQTVFSIGPNASLMIDTFIYDPATDAPSALVASVKKGSFKFISGKISKTSPDAMKLKLPNATASIRGTTVAGSVGLDGGASLVLLSGAVQLTSADTGLSADLIEPGWGVDVSATGDVGTPELYTEERLDTLLTQVEFKAGDEGAASDEDADDTQTDEGASETSSQEQDDPQAAENDTETDAESDNAPAGDTETQNTNDTQIAGQSTGEGISTQSEPANTDTLIDVLTPELLISENILGLDDEELAASEEAATELFTALLSTDSEEEAETLFKSFFEERLASIATRNSDDKGDDTQTLALNQVALGDAGLARSSLSSGLNSDLNSGAGLTEEPILTTPTLTTDLGSSFLAQRPSFNEIALDRSGLIDAALIGISSSFERQLETDLNSPNIGDTDFLEVASTTERQSRTLEEETREAAQTDAGPSAAEIRAGIEADLMDYLIAGGAPLWAITTYYTDTSTGQMGHPSSQTSSSNYDNLVSTAFKGSARFAKNDIELTRGQVSIPVNGQDTVYRSRYGGSGFADISFVMNYDQLSGSGTVRLREVVLITDSANNPAGVTYATASFPAAMQLSLSNTPSLVRDDDGNLRTARTMDMENFEISELNQSNTASGTTLAGSVHMSLGSIADGENAIDGLLGQFDIAIGQEETVEYVTNSDGHYLDTDGNVVSNAVEAATIPILSASEYVKGTAE